MPPKRSVAASPASQRGGTRLAPASPARSTRSMRSHREDEWDNESVQSSFKVPAPRMGHDLGLRVQNTSVNVAAAFSAAQSGHLPATSSYHKPAPRSQNLGRALSPAEQVADTARALSPVRYFLHPTDNNDSAEYPSFASMGNQSSNNTSYDYQKEEEFVRNRMKNNNGHSRKESESRRRKKAEDGDMPYRPAEDDWAVEAEGSEDEGQGIVRNGALDGRASTRGKTKDKGEGYLGMGLGIQPKKKQGRRSEDLAESDEDDLQEFDHSRHGFSRSPTPAQLLRAINPRVSPGPRPITPRRRQPSSLRTIITNLLHGLVMALRLVTDLLVGITDSVVIKPIGRAVGSGKMGLRWIKQHWLKVLGMALAACLLLRVLSRPNTIPSQGVVGSDTADELASRLSSLERAIASLSDNSLPPSNGQPSRDLVDRITRLETSLSEERNRLDELRGGSLSGIKSDLAQVVSRVDTHDKSLASARSQHQAVERFETELRGLKSRVDGVEVQVRNALDDGRLHKAIERILPEWMPIKRSKGGRIDVEPVFWNEMKKVLVGKSEVDKAVQDALAGRATGGLNEQDLERFGERLFEQKAAKGLVISREQFLQAMNNELEDLKSRLDRSPPKPSSVTIKTPKGDDVTSLLQDLVDAAILKYSKDTLATPDYALFTAGARVVPSITSDTLVLKSASTVGKWLAGSRDIEGRSPATALHPDNSVGSCWPFKGTQGQLGILLSRRVVITDVTIEHAPKELSPDTRTAPKTIEVWGLVEGEVNKAKVAEYIASDQALRSKSEVAPSPDHLLLASVEYDPSSDDPTQTFPIPPAIIDLGVDIGIVIFKVESNWGGELTCLYRVRVHGAMVEESE